MSITQDEFNVIQDVVKHVVSARKVALSLCFDTSSTDNMGRVFDPGTGLRYVLLDIAQQTGCDSKLFYKNNLGVHGIDVGGEPGTEVQSLSDIKQKEVSKYYELFILPNSIKKSLDNFYHEFSDSDFDSGSVSSSDSDFDSGSDTDPESETKVEGRDKQVISTFKRKVLEPSYNELVEFFKAEILANNPLFLCVDSHQMARYTVIGLLMNTVSLNSEIDSLKPILNKAISRFLNEKLELEARIHRDSLSLTSSVYTASSTIVIPSSLKSLVDVKKYYLQLVKDLQESFYTNVKIYSDARKKRVVSFLRDVIGVKQSNVTRWFFGIEKEVNSDKNPEDKVTSIIKLCDNLTAKEKQIIRTDKRYKAIDDFYKELEKINHKIRRLAV